MCSKRDRVHLTTLPLELLDLIADLLPPKSHFKFALTSRSLWRLLSTRAIVRCRYTTITASSGWTPEQSFLREAAPHTENLIITAYPGSGVSFDRYKFGHLLAAVNGGYLDKFVSEGPHDICMEYAPIFLPKLFYLKMSYLEVSVTEFAPGPMWYSLKVWDAIIDIGLLRNLTYVELYGRGLPFDAFLRLYRLPSLRYLYIQDVDWSDQSLMPSIYDEPHERATLKILQFAGSRISEAYWRAILGRIQGLEVFSYDYLDTGSIDITYCPYSVINALLDFHKESLNSLRLHTSGNSHVS